VYNVSISCAHWLVIRERSRSKLLQAYTCR